MSVQAPVSVRIITQLQPMTPMPGHCLTQREQPSRSRVGQGRVGQGRASCPLIMFLEEWHVISLGMAKGPDGALCMNIGPGVGKGP